MELEPYFFDNLYLAKQLWDAGVANRFLDWCGSLPVDTEEYYELFYDGVASVFEETKTYYNEEKEIETIVLFDPLIEEFFRLCREYERLSGVSSDANQIRKSGLRAVHESFGFIDYSCDWWLHDEQHGRPRLIILFNCDFYGQHALPGAVADSRIELESQISGLKKALAQLEPRPIITLQIETEKTELKEAA